MSRSPSWQPQPRRWPSSCITSSVIWTLACAGTTSSSNSSITAVVATSWAFYLYASLSRAFPEKFLCLLVSYVSLSCCCTKTKNRDRLDGRVECDGLRLGHGPSVRQREGARARPAHPSIRRLVRSVSTQHPTQAISLTAPTRRSPECFARNGYSAHFTIQMISRHSPSFLMNYRREQPGNRVGIR